MMNKMIGIILMVVGALVLCVGIVVYRTSSKDSLVATTHSEVGKTEIVKESSLKASITSSNEVKISEINSASEPQNKHKDNELEKVIEMAIADGVLTANERALIKQTAISKGVDYVAVLEDVEKRVDLLEIDSETELVDLKQKNV